MTILDGKQLSQKILINLNQEISDIKNCQPRLDIILVGNDPASFKYVENKNKKAKEVGIIGEIHHFAEFSKTQDIIKKIQELNSDPSVNGIMVQLPLPPQIDKARVLNSISFQKDVDGLTATNLGLLFQNHPHAYVPATPMGIIKLLKEYNYDFIGKNAVIVGRSPIVGIPLTALFLKENATVTVCHSRTQNLQEITKNADILITAISKSKYFTSEFVKGGVAIIDVSTNIDQISGKLTGDIDFDSVSSLASIITPVPGGVGPMTIACLLENTFTAWKRQN